MTLKTLLILGFLFSFGISLAEVGMIISNQKTDF